MVRCTQLLIFISSLYYSSKPFYLSYIYYFLFICYCWEMMILFSLTAIFLPYMWPVCCCLLPASPRSPPPPPLPHRHWGCTFFSSTLIMPTLNELLLLGSRPKQLLLCLYAHRKRELSPNILSWYHPFNIISFTMVFIKLSIFFSLLSTSTLLLGSKVVYSLLMHFINSLPNFLAIYIYIYS